MSLKKEISLTYQKIKRKRKMATRNISKMSQIIERERMLKMERILAIRIWQLLSLNNARKN